MNSRDALKLMVREYPGGLEAVAHALGKAASTLDKELRGATGYKLGVTDACAITAMCHEINSPHAAAYATAVAASCGACVSIAAPSTIPREIDLLRDTGRMLREISGLVASVTTANEDGRISLNELRLVEAEAREAMTAVQALVADIERAHEASKPAHLREVRAS